MKKFFLPFLLVVLSMSFAAHAQLDFGKLVNPGPLSSPHASLEGISNCTKCHSSAKGVPDEKCLDCHKEIKDRIAARKGYHARVSGTCVSCHNEHKGTNYDLMGFSRVVFDHTDTGWPLTGDHQNLDCTKCHTKTRKSSVTGAMTQYKTYLGNNSDCKSCHNDIHDSRKATFKACYKCHDTTSWAKRANSNFNHNKETQFTNLTGAHVDLKCFQCHTNKKWGPMETTCVSCHADPHKGQFGTTCETCHNTKAWNQVQASSTPAPSVKAPTGKVPVGKIPTPSVKGATPPSKLTGGFDHDKTKFPLKGQHLKVACKSCHGNTIGKLPKINFTDCAGCHKDPHKGQFGKQKCSTCHTFEGFNIIKGMSQAPVQTPTAQPTEPEAQLQTQAPQPQVVMPSNFDHNRTGFPLVGKHQAVVCASCHQGGVFKGLSHACSSCHNDFHKGELGTECERCHSPAIGFNDVDFDHNRMSRFKIDGQHVKNQCLQCHWNYKFKFGEFSCSTCHVDVHKGSFGPACDKCHTTAGFKMQEGFHEFGSFRITGVHNKLDCVTCHNPKAPARARPMECTSCHKDPHMGSLSPDCYTCHNQTAWMPTSFRHNQTGFELSGAHRFLSCEQCHFNRVFGGLSSECVTCHSKDFNASLPQHVGAPTTCNTCHYTFGFRPAK